MMVFDIFIISQAFENQTDNFLELLLVLWLKIATNVLCLLLKLPLKACILFATFIDSERNWVHVCMNWQLIFLLFFSMELNEKMMGYIFSEGNDTIV